jgi:hypothetical protein
MPTVKHSNAAKTIAAGRQEGDCFVASRGAILAGAFFADAVLAGDDFGLRF